MTRELAVAHANRDGIPAFTTIIAGQRVGAMSGEQLLSHSPSTGEALGYFPRLGRGDVERAAAAAERAQRAWRATTPQERARRVVALAERLLERREELAQLDSSDNGSPVAEMRADVDKAAAQLRYLAGLAVQVHGSTLPPVPDRLTLTIREPYGVVGRIIAFNHPLMFAAVKIAAPVLAGNTVLLKPSEHTSLSALALAPDFEELLGPSVVQVITGLGSEAGDAIVTHPRIRRIAFIGSASTGRRIQASAAGAAVKNISLELGGKNAIVVMPDADMAAAADGAMRGMNFTWQGQSCGSTSRLLVHEDSYPAFVTTIARRIEELRAGFPDDTGNDLGAMVNEDQLRKVLDYVEIGVREGATLATGGERLTAGGLDRGNFVSPALFTGVAPDSRLGTEEIFGPVLSAIAFTDYDDAVRIVNSTEYGLTASIYTSDLSTAMKFAHDVEVGYVWINEVSIHVAGAPYGGYKESGVGREEDFSEIESYTQVKSVHINFRSSRLGQTS